VQSTESREHVWFLEWKGMKHVNQIVVLSLFLGLAVRGSAAGDGGPLPPCDTDVHSVTRNGVKTYVRLRAGGLEQCQLTAAQRAYVLAPECVGRFHRDASDAGYVMSTDDGGTVRCNRVFR
jgi:hypothetical protein